MERDTPQTTPESPHHAHVNAGFVVSVQSVVWTVAASLAAIALGVRSHAAVLVAFGAVGIVDAIGSIALAYHFHHGLRHEQLSDELERLAHRVVLVGLFLVGTAAVIGGLARLTLNESSEASDAGVVLAALSLVALIALSARKRFVGRRVASKALLSDGHLSAIGAMQAAVALLGIALARWLGWQWADAAATVVVGGFAAALAVVTWRREMRRCRRARRYRQLGRGCGRRAPQSD